jgi:two-component system, cell cycle response regulator
MTAPAPPSEDVLRARHQRIPRLTKRVFTDLAIWMIGFGLVIGAVFPAAIVVLGVPAEYAFRPGFFAATLAAGLLVGAVNFALSQSVVGTRVRSLSERMSFVTSVLREATFSGDRSQCDPERCRLPVDSEDALGDAAQAFNELLATLATAHAVEDAQADFTRDLAAHLDVGDLSQAALAGFVGHAGAEAGALLLVRDGSLTTEAVHRLDGSHVADNPTLLDALRHPDPVLIEVPDGLRVDAGLLTFRPAAVALLPVHFKAAPIALVVLAFREKPTADTMRLIDHLRDSSGVALNNALAYERFQHLAAIDPLTGVYNRRFGLGRLKEEWGRALRSDTPLGVVAFDLDHFKAVNDTYGHLTGDRVLRDVTAAARVVLRDGDVLVRTGGEEFLAVLPGAGSADTEAIAERIRRNVEGLEVAADGGVVHPTVSLGCAVYPLVSVDSPEQLGHLADEALYASKRSGRNRVTMASTLDVAARSA